MAVRLCAGLAALAKRLGEPLALLQVLVADLRGDPSLAVTRVEFHRVDEPDPRATLAAAHSL